MGLTELIIGSYQVDKGKKAMKALEAQGVSPLSPEYIKMQGMAEEMARSGFTQQEIQAYLNQQLSASNAAFNAQRNMAGGNLSQAMGATQALQMQQANAAMAAKDAELKRSNVQTLFNVYQTLQQQKNLNQERYDKQMAAANAIAAAGAQNVATGITDIKNTVLGSFTGGKGNTGQSGFKTPVQGTMEQDYNPKNTGDYDFSNYNDLG
jgi:hypothetical protein